MTAQRSKNPALTVDLIVQKGSQLLAVKRKNEPFKGYLSLPGGFVDEGERVEDAAKREVKEETSLDVQINAILGVYSDPKRDPRRHTASVVFIGVVSENHMTEALAKDDAEELEWLDLDGIENKRFGFDHKQILLDYKAWTKSNGTFWSSKTRI
jgi:8-oxo-dGTP diphosphatase